MYCSDKNVAFTLRTWYQVAFYLTLYHHGHHIAQSRFFDPSSLSLGTKVTPCLFVHRKPWVVAPPALPDKPWFQRRRIPREPFRQRSILKLLGQRPKQATFITASLSVAAGLGLEPSHPVLETSALANILTRSIVFVFVCPKRQASFRFVKKGDNYVRVVGVEGFEPSLDGFSYYSMSP